MTEKQMVGSCATVKCKNQNKYGECELGIDNDCVILLCAEFEFEGYYD